MLTFNDLLALEGRDITAVRLVRNQDSRLGRGRMYEAWRNNRQAFEDYLGVQSKDRFPVGGLLAEFVVTEAQKRSSWGCTKWMGSGCAPLEAWTRS